MRVPYRAAYYVQPSEKEWAVLTGPGEMGLSDADLIEAALVAAERSRLIGVPWREATSVQILERMILDPIDDLQECYERTGSYWSASRLRVRPSEAISLCAALVAYGYRLGRRTRVVWNERSRLREMAQRTERAQE